MRYGFKDWCRDLVCHAFGKFLVGLASASAIITIVASATGVVSLAYCLPISFVALFAVAWAAYDVHRRTISRLPGAGLGRDTAYDVFLAAPMAATENEDEYRAIRSMTQVVERSLRTACALDRVYWAGRDIEAKTGFDQEDHAFVSNFKALLSSRFFLLLLPKPRLSSVLVEAGYAFAHRIPTVIFVNKADDLPYVLRKISQAMTWVKVYPSGDVDFGQFIEATIKRHGNRILRDIEDAAKVGG